MSEPNGIYKAMCDAMADIDAIAKDRTNVQQNFKFRGIDDVYNELHSILAKHRIFTLPEVLEERTEERQTKSGGNLIYRVLRVKHHFCHEDGSSVSTTVIGEGMDSGDKAANKAMSISHKYSLFQAFLIPTEDDKDPDAQSHAVIPKTPAPKKVDPAAYNPADKPPDTAEAKKHDNLDQKQMQLRIKDMMLTMFPVEGFGDQWQTELEHLTSFKKGDDVVPGVANPFELNTKPNKQGETRTGVTYVKVRALFDKFQKDMEVTDADAT